MKRVGIDLQAMLANNPSGLGYYVAGLYQGLKQQTDPKLEIVGLKGSKPTDLSSFGRWQHDRFELPKLANAAKVDLLHQPSFSCPPYNKPVVWTLADLRPLILKEPMRLPSALYWRRWLPYSQRFADLIVGISQAAVDDGIRIFKRPSSDFRVIPVGLPNELYRWAYSSTKAKQFRQKFGLTKRYLASVGTLQPIKNWPFLIKVFDELRHNLKLDYQLVIIGKKGWDYPNVQRQIADLGLTEGKEVIITGYATDDEKWTLIHDAEAFVFPSLYEGFGIPPIEAQYLGVPVISSDTSSLPDVVGQGGLLVSPRKIEPWLRAIETTIAKRPELVRLGRENVKRFNWQVIAKQWHEVYREVLGL